MPRIALLAEASGIAEQALHVLTVKFLIVGKAEVGGTELRRSVTTRE
jgi:hypothetical protein